MMRTDSLRLPCRSSGPERQAIVLDRRLPWIVWSRGLGDEPSRVSIVCPPGNGQAPLAAPAVKPPPRDNLVDRGVEYALTGGMGGLDLLDRVNHAVIDRDGLAIR